MKIEAVILDFDGTLVDSEPIWKKVILEIFSDLGYKISNEVLMGGTGMGLDACVPYMLSHAKLEHLNSKEIITKIQKEVYVEIIRDAKIHTGFNELMNVIAEKKLPCGICTASEFDLLIPTLERLEIKHHFKVLHSAHGAINVKPHPEPYLLTAKKLRIDIRNCIVIEDSIPGISSGVASGAKTFGIPSQHDLQEAKTLGATIVNDLSQVADYISYEENHTT